MLLGMDTGSRETHMLLAAFAAGSAAATLFFTLRGRPAVGKAVSSTRTGSTTTMMRNALAVNEAQPNPKWTPPEPPPTNATATAATAAAARPYPIGNEHMVTLKPEDMKSKYKFFISAVVPRQVTTLPFLCGEHAPADHAGSAPF